MKNHEFTLSDVSLMNENDEIIRIILAMRLNENSRQGGIN